MVAGNGVWLTRSIAYGVTAWLIMGVVAVAGCRPAPKTEVTAEPETVARTEFTERIENYFEYEPLHPGKPSRFLIHLTDLSDGAPVENAAVVLTLRSTSGAPVQTTARVSKVTGIYVAEVSVPQAGDYTVEFHVKNSKLDERMAVTGVQTEQARK